MDGTPIYIVNEERCNILIQNVVSFLCVGRDFYTPGYPVPRSRNTRFPFYYCMIGGFYFT